MFNSKKKPSLAIMMIGKGGPKADPESPDSLEQPAAKPFGKSAAPPFGKQPPAASPMVDETSAAHEAAESPEYEQAEETGAPLVQAIESAGEQVGLDAARSRSFAADIFGALAESLRRGSEPGDDEGAEGEYSR